MASYAPFSDYDIRMIRDKAKFSDPSYDRYEMLRLLATLDEARRERDELKRDIDHAVAEAKRRVPDYPWDQNTASECVWALGESLLGVTAANDEWQEHAKKLEAERDAAVAAERERCAKLCDEFAYQSETQEEWFREEEGDDMAAEIEGAAGMAARKLADEIRSGT
jgi:hypothetical protein